MSRMIHHGLMPVLALLAGFSVAGSSVALAQQPILTSRLLQDEVQELPADHSAFFTAARQVSIQLDLLAAVDEDLDEALVSVVSLDGQRRNFQPDSSGRVTITEVEEGPHAIVASGKSSHGATVVYFEEQLPDEPEAAAQETQPTKVTMVGIQPNTLRGFVDQISHLSGSPGDVTRSVSVGPSFSYRVALQSDGTLKGRVYALVGFDGQQSSGLVTGKAVEGTRITILRGGAKVGNAVADETGRFQIPGLSPGVHGCVGVGSKGYAALAFEAVGPAEVVQRRPGQKKFVSFLDPDPTLADELPVILIPPAMIPEVLEAIREYYPDLFPMIDAEALLAGEPITVPFGGGFATTGTGFGGGGGGSGGAGVGGGDIVGILGAIGIAAAAANNGDGGGFILLPSPPASPSNP